MVTRAGEAKSLVGRDQYDEAVAMHAKAVRQGLRGAALLEDVDECARTCNGIGPGWFPEWLRWAITEVNPTLVPTAWIHDRRYSQGGGIWKRWTADWEFLRNGWMAAFHGRRWNDPCAYARGWKATVFWLALRAGGQGAFNWRAGKGD
jgi:hypothetical protein